MTRRIVFTQQPAPIQPIPWAEFLATAAWSEIPVIYMNRDTSYDNRIMGDGKIRWQASAPAAGIFAKSMVRHQTRKVALVSYKDHDEPVLLGAYVGRQLVGLTFELTLLAECLVPLRRPSGHPSGYYALLGDLRRETL